MFIEREREIVTIIYKAHPTCGQCRTPPFPPNVNVHGHVQGECNRSVK